MYIYIYIYVTGPAEVADRSSSSADSASIDTIVHVPKPVHLLSIVRQ
jgi:hypothetical protein